MSTGGYPGTGSVSTESEDPVRGVSRSAGVVGQATLASRVLGLVRDVVLANLFDKGLTDAFFMAFMIPNLFRRLVAEGSLTVAFVPIFTGELERSHEAAARMFRATLGAVLAVGVGIALGGVLLADPLVSLFAPGFALEPGKHELTVRLLRICFPYILLLMLVATAMGALNAMGHFFAPAIAPVLLNLSLIVGALLGVAVADPAIVALAWAVVVAGILQVLLQVPPLLRHRLPPRPTAAIGEPALRRLGALMLPAVLGASVFQLNVLVSRFLASFLGDGAVSYLYYASRVMELPLGVFVFAIGTASLPSFSRLISSRDGEGLRRGFTGALALTLSLLVPSTLGLIWLAEPIFAVLFGWNASVFDAEAVRLCAAALALYALGLIPVGVSRIAVGLCVAHQNTRTPARAAVVGLAVNLLASLALIGPLPAGRLPVAVVEAQRAIAVAELGLLGLALATTLAAFANAAFLVAVVRRRYGRVLAPGLLGRVARICAASAAMAAVLWIVALGWPIPTASGGGPVAVLSGHVALGALAYAGFLKLLRSPELGSLLAVVRRR